MTSIMDKFEKQFEDLDVQTQYMDSSMSATTTLTTPEGQVDELMRQVADEHGLELNMELDARTSRRRPAQARRCRSRTTSRSGWRD